MIKKTLILLGLLALCSSCVSRTTLAPSTFTGSEKEVIRDKKIIWFWQKEFYQ